MATKYTTTTEFKGYTNRAEETNTDPGYLVSGSSNVIIDQMFSISSRKGCVIEGSTGSTGNGIDGAFSWRTSRGQFYTFRKYNDVLQVRQKIVTSGVTTYQWNTIYDGTYADVMVKGFASFESVYNSTKAIDELIICAGNTKFFSWSGASALVLSSTSNTITLQGTKTWGQLGFPATGTVRVGSTDYAYTGGASTTTLTGVTPSAAGIAVGSFAYDKIISRTINVTGGIPAFFTCDYVGVFRNQVYIGSKTNRNVFASDAVDYSNWVTSTAVGGPRVFTIDDNCAGFVASKTSVLVFGQDQSIFQIRYTISSDQTKSLFEIERLITAPNQGLASDAAKVRIKNSVIYLTKDRTLDTIEFVENIVDIQTLQISDVIKNDMDAYVFTGASMASWERNAVIALPSSNVFLLYDLVRKIWQPPMTLSGIKIGMFSVGDDGELIGHSADKNESYTMFTGTNDNGAQITSSAVFAYNNFGDRFALKRFTQYVQDGYISANGKLTRKIDYDYRGSRGSVPIDFTGGELKNVYYIEDNAGLGEVPLGERPLSGSSLLPPDNQRRFRYGDSLEPKNFYELRVTYSMGTLDGTWRVVSHGADVGLSTSGINDIIRIR
jgi:hypothetical protein